MTRIFGRPLARLAAFSLLCGGVGCTDPRQEAVEDVLDFATRAPFELDAPQNEFLGYSVVVSQVALAEFNELFAYFETDGADRVEAYRRVQADLFWTIPITGIESSSYQTNGDTLLAAVVISRPDGESFEARMFKLLDVEGTPAPSQETQDAFTETLTRVRSELQEADTVFMSVVDGPRIVSMRTASMIRDSVETEALRRAGLDHLTELVASAELIVDEFKTYARDPSLGADVSSSLPRPSAATKGWEAEGRVCPSLRFAPQILPAPHDRWGRPFPKAAVGRGGEARREKGSQPARNGEALHGSPLRGAESP